MTIAAFPTALQPAIQQGFLQREFQTGLESTTVYRSIADLEIFPANVGETITKTRKGLKAPVTTPLNPSSNTNLDNGLTPTGWTIEQYSLGVDMYGDTMDLNMVTQRVGIADQFLHNAYTNGRQSAQSIDRIARKVLLDAYQGGNTRVTTTLGANGPTIAVDDVRGFQVVPRAADNTMVAVSTTNKLVVYVNGTTYNCQAVAVDGSNTSTTPGGKSGTLTMDANVTVANGTAGNAVVAYTAPTVLRAGGRKTHALLQAGDMFTMGLVLDAVTQLRNNGVPTVNGRYNCYMDPTSQRQLFADADFKQLYQGAGGTNAAREFEEAQVLELLNVRFLPTTEAVQQVNGTVNIHRPIVCGAGAMVEGVFADEAYTNLPQQNMQGIIDIIDGIVMITRPPLDRLQQIIAQSWYYIGGFTVPTDVTATQNIIPTASNAVYKRAVLIEHA